MFSEGWCTHAHMCGNSLAPYAGCAIADCDEPWSSKKLGQVTNIFCFYYQDLPWIRGYDIFAFVNIFTALQRCVLLPARDTI